MLDSVPRCDLVHINHPLPPLATTHFSHLDVVSPIPFPSPLLPTHAGGPSPIEEVGSSVEATLAGRTQAWWSGDLGSNASPAAGALQNLGRTSHL